MKKVISYKDLVLNTLLDTVKREKRYTIDNIDIMNYEDVISQIIKYNKLDITIGNLENRHEFVKEISEYTHMSTLGDKQLYTLLPWISEEELENDIENTIFSPVDMQNISEVTKEYLRFSRDSYELFHLTNIDRKVAREFTGSIKSNIKSLENETEKEKQKLQKIKSRMGR